MNKDHGFWKSLEEYVWGWVGKSPLPWQYVGVGIVLLGLVASAVGVRNSTAGANTIREVVERAAEVGDYATARSWDRNQEAARSDGRVLGEESELEKKVYPERRVEEKITEVAELLEKYPGHRDILLELASLHKLIGNTEQAEKYGEAARVLDPNNPIFAR